MLIIILGQYNRPDVASEIVDLEHPPTQKNFSPWFFPYNLCANHKENTASKKSSTAEGHVN
jgi:hypothetical protein